MHAARGLGILATGLPVLGQQAATGNAPGNPQGRVLHITGYSHIDAAWLWPWRDGSNLALTTFRSALDRLKETPDFRYCHSSSMHYSWVERADPKMFEEVRARGGRIIAVAGESEWTFEDAAMVWRRKD